MKSVLHRGGGAVVSIGAYPEAGSGRLARLMIVLIALAVLMLGVLPTHAAMVSPGGSMLAPAEPAPTGSVLASSTSPFSTAFYSGSVTSQVLGGDSTNSLNGLTFTYQVTIDAGSPGGIERINGIDYSGFATDASFVAGTGTGIAPTTVDRGSGAAHRSASTSSRCRLVWAC